MSCNKCRQKCIPTYSKEKNQINQYCQKNNNKYFLERSVSDGCPSVTYTECSRNYNISYIYIYTYYKLFAAAADQTSFKDL